MADFSYLSDTDDSAVEDLISQAQDLCVLEHLSAINCSSFTHSPLPTHLDSRFRKLKSFPLTKPSHPPPYHEPGLTSVNKNEFKHSFKSQTESGEQHQNPDETMGLEPKSGSGSSFSPMDKADFSVAKQSPGEKTGLGGKLGSGSASSPSNSLDLLKENAVSAESKRNPEGEKCLKAKSRRGSFDSGSDSPNSSMESLSPSPPQRTGCFWCSPKRVSRRKSKDNGVAGVGFEWGKSDEILSDWSVFSAKEQKRRLKKAMKEEERISREAEKIVKWAKQASARIDVSGIEDELSDVDDDNVAHK